MKEFHIISSGVSVLTNAQKAGILPQDRKISDEDYWKSLIDNPREINNLAKFLQDNPYENSAELNTFLRVVKEKDPSQVEVYLFGTKTYSNELCRRVLENYLKTKGFKIYTPFEVSGYFWESKYDESYAVDEFKKGISELLDRLIYLANKKMEEGYKVFFNPTGGLKAHVITTALAGFLTDSAVYYMNEEFNEVVFLPALFYLPKGREIEILKELSSKGIISGKEAEKKVNNFTKEIQRLCLYTLIELEEDESNKPYRLKITNKGRLVLDKLGI